MEFFAVKSRPGLVTLSELYSLPFDMVGSAELFMGYRELTAPRIADERIASGKRGID